jgi:ABC-type transport system substrate-binding protein
MRRIERKMISNRARRGLALTLVAAFMMMAVSPIFVAAQPPLPDDWKVGPYIDKIVFDVITQADQQVLALQNDEVDIIDSFIEPDFVPVIEATENVATLSTLRNGYGLVDINTAKYPLNITNFRRAVAFSLDKQGIQQDIFEGLSQAQDSVVPFTNPFTVEGQLEYTYYERNVEEGIRLLDLEGFVDVDDDGWREAPNGEAFEVVVEAASSSNVAQEVGTFVAEAMTDMGVNSHMEITDFYEYLNRLYFHGDYDMVFYAQTWTSFDVDWLGIIWDSANADVPFQNPANWRNATFDSWIDQLLYSTDYDDVYEAAIEMQKIWVHAVPRLVCYENEYIFAFRDDSFVGFVNDRLSGAASYWSNNRVQLIEDGPFGGTLRWAQSLDINTFNYLGSSTSGYTQDVLENVAPWGGLQVVDEDGYWRNWLAESVLTETHADNVAVPEGYTRFTVDMLQNVTYSDGEAMTAEDAAFSLNYFRDAPGNPIGPDLQTMTAAYAPTPYTLVVEFDTESYWNLHNFIAKPIIPKHFFENIPVEDWNLWQPDPLVDEYVTAGPFYVSDRVEGEFTELTYDPDFVFAPDRILPTTTTSETPPPQVDMTMAIVAGAVGAAVVILVGGYVLMRQR